MQEIQVLISQYICIVEVLPRVWVKNVTTTGQSVPFNVAGIKEVTVLRIGH